MAEVTLEGVVLALPPDGNCVLISIRIRLVGGHLNLVGSHRPLDLGPFAPFLFRFT